MAYESLKSMKGQIVANFIVEHRIDNEHDISVDLVSLYHGGYTLMVQFVEMAKVLVLFMYPLMVLFLKPLAV